MSIYADDVVNFTSVLKIAYNFLTGRDYLQKKKEKTPVRLVNGNDLIKRFKLKPSVLIGMILSEIEEAQAIGRIKTRDEALTVAQRVIKMNRRPSPLNRQA